MTDAIEVEVPRDQGIALQASAWTQRDVPKTAQLINSAAVFGLPALMFGALITIAAWQGIGDTRAVFVGAMAAGAWAFGWPEVINWLGNRHADRFKAVDSDDPTHMRFNEHGYVVTTTLTETRVDWAAVLRLEQTPTGLFFLEGGLVRYIGPKDITKEEAAQIIAWREAA